MLLLLVISINLFHYLMLVLDAISSISLNLDLEIFIRFQKIDWEEINLCLEFELEYLVLQIY